MDSIWLKIASAAVLGTMLFFLYPTAKHWFKHGPKAKKGDWSKAVIPLLVMVGFVILLIMMVR
jgi:archaellum biogenesis protein FlaJ (TadC family)